MGGERPITVKIAELDLYGSGQWIPVKDVKVPHGYLGFKLRIETKSRFAGNHKLQYTATNSVPGGPIWIQSLNLREVCFSPIFRDFLTPTSKNPPSIFYIVRVCKMLDYALRKRIMQYSIKKVILH